MTSVDYINKQILIHLDTDLGQRLSSKFSVYLSTISHKYLVKFNTKENYLVGDILFDSNKDIFKKILNWFESNNIEFYISDSFRLELDTQATKINEFALQQKTALEFKNNINALEHNSDYLDFKKFCDESLKITLLDYQYLASYFMKITNGGFDFSVPGSGKTIITYSFFNYLFKNKLIKRVLIIGPLNSKYAWKEEYYTCFHEEADFMDLSNFSISEVKNYLNQTKLTKLVSFLNYDKVKSLSSSIHNFLSQESTMLVLDEAHKLKNPNAKVTQSLLSFSNNAIYKVILTGTPMPNGHEDLFSLTKIFNSEFRIINKSYGELSKIKKSPNRSSIEKELFLNLKPFFSRISKKILINQGKLQNAQHSFINTIMSTEQRLIYDFIDNIKLEISSILDNFIKTNFAKAVLIRKMQASSNPLLLEESLSKWLNEYTSYYNSQNELDSDSSLMDETKGIIEADRDLMEIINNSEIQSYIQNIKKNNLQPNKNIQAINLALKLINDGNKVIIWDTFVKNIDALREYIKSKFDISFEIIYGATSLEERQRILDNFKNGDLNLLIANPSTLAESISLHKSCQHAIYLNRNYNAAQFIQSKDRIHRINMPIGKTANYYYFINENSIDTKINTRLIEKETNMLNTLDAEEISIGGVIEESGVLSIEDLINAFN